jgi:hypothetical protein
VALSRARELAAEVAILTSDYPGLQRFTKAAAGLVTYIDNNAAAIPDYGERRRYAEPISTAFTESTVNLVVGKRFAKKQQMQWSKAGAHLLLQTRTQTLDGTLPETFRRWYPAMAANDAQMPAAAAWTPHGILCSPRISLLIVRTEQPCRYSRMSSSSKPMVAS